jgi:hypothetical protein
LVTLPSRLLLSSSTARSSRSAGPPRRSNLRPERWNRGSSRGYSVLIVYCFVLGYDRLQGVLWDFISRPKHNYLTSQTHHRDGGKENSEEFYKRICRYNMVPYY